MIKGLLFALAEVAVLWLAVWMFLIERGKPARWTPFDFRDAAAKRKAKAEPRRESHANWRRRAR